MATLSARFYTTTARVFYRKATGSESHKIAILIRPTGHEKPEITRRVTDVGVRRRSEFSLQRRIVRVWVRTERAADAQKPGAEILVAPQVLGLEARPLGGETVSPAQDGEFLAERSGGAG